MASTLLAAYGRFARPSCLSVQRPAAAALGVQHSKLLQPFAGCTAKRPTSLAVFHRSYSSSSNEQSKKSNSEVQQVSEEDDMKNLGLFQRFKKMYRDYWYVLIPVHLATSAVWVGIFYYLAT
ncbi:hypothetical protein B566_EDAN018427, partial [Ephemera danica]